MAQLKYSTNRGDHWDVEFWLVFDAWGGVRLTRGEPDLNKGERSMFMRSKIPHSLFRLPSLRASITVPDPGTDPITIDTTAAAEALKKVIGAEISVTVVQPEDA